MMIIIEFDKNFTFGVDILRRVFGLRLGFVGIHLVLAKMEDIDYIE